MVPLGRIKTSNPAQGSFTFNYVLSLVKLKLVVSLIFSFCMSILY